MKRTQFKDLIRNIRKQFVSWLSILIIAMMAITAFLAVRFSSESLHDDANNIYQDCNYRDFELVSTILFDEEDVSQIAALSSVKDAEGIYLADGVANCASASKTVSIISLTERINIPYIFSGRLPQTNDECALEIDIANTLKARVGDVVTIEENNDQLLYKTFTVTGIVCHPDHLAMEKQVPGNRYVVVIDEIFNKEAYLNCFSKVEVLLKDIDNYDRYGKTYLRNVKAHMNDFDRLGEERTAIRMNAYRNDIASNEEKLADAYRELSSARSLLNENRQKLSQARLTLDQARITLNDSASQLADGRRQLQEGQAKLIDAKKQLDDGKKELDKGQADLFGTYNLGHQLRIYIQNYIKTSLRKYGLSGKLYNLKWITDFDVDDPDLSLLNLPITDTFTLDLLRFSDQVKRYPYIKEVFYQQFTDAEIATIYSYYYGSDDPTLSKEEKIDRIVEEKIRPDLEEQIRQYEEFFEVSLTDLGKSVAAWDSEHKRYIENKRTYEEKIKEYDEGLATFKDGVEQLNDAQNRYYSGLKQYNDGCQEYDDSLKLLNEKESEYSRAESEYQDNLAKLNKYKEMIEAMDSSKWIAFSCLQSTSYLGIDSISSNFSNISSTFSLLFVFVGALVIYATVGKIIEEQRTMVGTTKALGFYNREVFLKYLGFGLSATLIGVLLGIVLSQSLFQRFFVGQALQFFHLGEGVLHFSLLDAIVVVLLAILLCVASVYFACFRLIRTPVKDLMVPEVPKTRKRKGGNSHGSLYSRLILRNMLSDPKRILVTIVSIAGCCALLIIGFTVRHAISYSNVLEYSKIFHYDYHVKYNLDVNENVEKEIEDVLSGYDAKYARSAYLSQPMMTGDTLSMTSLICMDYDDIRDFYAMNDPKTLEPLDLQDGLYITIRQNENYGFKPGGQITFLDNKLDEKTADVIGYFESYANNNMVISDKAYKQVFGYDVTHDRYLIIADDELIDDIRTELLNIPGVTSFDSHEELRAQSESFISIADYMLIMLTFMAAVMAYFIIFNLTNTYISQRRRELTVMRINGFTVREVVNYVSLEMYLTSAIGIVLGWFLGSAIGRRIVIMIQNHSVYVRSAYLPGWLWASLITALFTVVIIRNSLRKVKYLKLTDI